MPVPRIFISHHSKDDPDLLWRVHDALKAAGFKVLMDVERLGPGDDWRAEIYTWIWQAHGAVVLITEEGRKSKWVKYEIAALTSRLWKDKGFRLVTLLAGLDDKVLRDEFEPQDLARLQAIRTDAPQAIDKVVDEFRPLLNKFSETPIDSLERVVADELPPKSDVLEKAIEKLAIELRNDDVVDAPFVARSFFHAAIERIRDGIAAIAEGGGRRSQVQKIVDIVLPFWIDPQAILELAREALTPAGPHRILLVNAAYPSIGKLYAHRAALQYPMKWEVVPTSAAATEDVVDLVRKDMRDKFRAIDVLLTMSTDAEVDDAIRSTAQLDPVVVVIPGAKLEHLITLRGHYPECIFVALVGGNVPEPAALEANQTIVLEPRLENAREQLIKVHWLACQRIVKNTAE